MGKENKLDYVKLRNFTPDQLKELRHVKALVKLEQRKNSSGQVTSTNYFMEVKLFGDTMTLRFYLKEPAFFIIKKIWNKTSNEFYIQVPYRLVSGESEDLREDHKGKWNKYGFFETLPCGVNHPELYLNKMFTNLQISQLETYNYLNNEYFVIRGRKENPLDQMDEEIIETKN